MPPFAPPQPLGDPRQAFSQPSGQPFGDANAMGDLMNKLIAKYGPDFRELALSTEGDEVGDDIALLINGQSYHTLGGLKAELKDSDIILMGMTAVGG